MKSEENVVAALRLFELSNTRYKAESTQGTGLPVPVRFDKCYVLYEFCVKS